MGNRLFAHVTHPHEYAARVHDPHVYHAVSLDLLHRWLYPNVPENNNIHSGDRTTYRCVFLCVLVCVCWCVGGWDVTWFDLIEVPMVVERRRDMV